MARELVRKYLKLIEPDLVAQRLANRLVRCTFYAAGVNHFWAMDQHDKWLRFGLHWHGCIEGFTGKIIWLTVWWNNANPKYVCAQYLKAVRQFGVFIYIITFFVDLPDNKYIGAPCVTQSDRGTENFNVAYAHTHIRHSLDATLVGSIQHQWKYGHTNVKPEQMWSRFRKTWVPGFERLLDEGIKRQWYDIINITDRCVAIYDRIWTVLTHHAYLGIPERLVFRWLAIPWLQREADSYVYGHNTSRRMPTRHNVLPSGVPDVIFENPESFDALDFKVHQHPTSNEEWWPY